MTAINECPDHGPLTEYRNHGGKVVWTGCPDCFRHDGPKTAPEDATSGPSIGPAAVPSSGAHSGSS